MKKNNQFIYNLLKKIIRSENLTISSKNKCKELYFKYLEDDILEGEIIQEFKVINFISK
jgi:hypothetical protein